MKVAVVGSRDIIVQDLELFLPKGITEIVSGGARGVDSCARAYAEKHNIKFTEFLPDYARYRGGATAVRNRKIIEYCDTMVAFWDGASHGTRNAVRACKQTGKRIILYLSMDDGIHRLDQ